MAHASGSSDTESASEHPTPLDESHHNDALSKLPRREGLWRPLVLYRNYWLEEYVAMNTMLLQETFEARPDDTILASSPKCGTTWLKALAFAVANRARHSPGDENHPLLTRHAQQLVPYLELPWNGDRARVEALPSPRLLGTHLPLSLLPDSVDVVSRHGGGCRVVYISRDPKDAFVSYWHFKNRVHGRAVDLADAFAMYCEGVSIQGPFWSHALEYWDASVARPDSRVLFLRYEEVMRDPVKHVRTLAAFLGAPFTGEEEDAGVPEEVVRLCSFETLSGLPVNRTGELDRWENGVVERSVFFRRGKVGDWVNCISDDMARKLDGIVEEKLKGSGLVL